MQIERRQDHTLELSTLVESANDYIRHSKADNTLKAYQSDWNDFTTWCESKGLDSLPASPKTVSLYIANLANTCKPSTIQRRMSSVSKAHQAAGFESPTQTNEVRTVWAGIRRVNGTAQHGKKAAVVDDIRLMVDTLADNLLGIRDRALLLVGFAGAFRRSELVSLDVGDIEVTMDGLVITLKRSKTDQDGEGRKVGIPYGSNRETCPVRSYITWLTQSGITSGPIFRSINRHGQLQDGRLSDKAVALVVKRCAEATGLDASQYAGHSLRSGLATTAAANGVSERAIMNQTGHRSVQMVRRYIREGSLFNDNAAAKLGL